MKIEVAEYAQRNALEGKMKGTNEKHK